MNETTACFDEALEQIQIEKGEQAIADLFSLGVISQDESEDLRIKLHLKLVTTGFN